MDLSQRLTAVVVFSTALIGSGCSINPATGGIDAVFKSESAEIEEGRKAYQEITASAPLYPQDSLAAYVQSVGERVAKVGDRPTLKYTFTIIDSQDINAFALPGGYIFINRGLLAYLQNEAQLAAVLAHEVAHVTARHHVRQHSGTVGAKTAAVFTTILTRSTTVGEATSLWAASAVSGFGREMELEADKFGAQYLARAGYDPDAMIEVISILKDQERFSKIKAKAQGRKPITYHGVFSTHPRNDKRLKQLVAEAGKQQQGTVNTGEFRQQIKGLYFGPGVSPVNAEPNRYFHKRLRFTFLHPDGWSISPTRTAIVTRDGKGNQITLGVKRLRVKNNPRAFTYGHFTNQTVTDGKERSINGLAAFTARVDNTPTTVIFYNGRAYIFQSQGDDSQQETIEASITSFRPLARGEQPPSDDSKLTFIRATTKTRFADLAARSPIPEFAEEQLRLLNGYYPYGEPEAGQILKVVR